MPTNTLLSRRADPLSHSVATLRFSSSPPLSVICPLLACFWTGPFDILVPDAPEPAVSAPVVAFRLSSAVPEIFEFWSPERRERDLSVRQRFQRGSLIAPRALSYSMRASYRRLDRPDRPVR